MSRPSLESLAQDPAYRLLEDLTSALPDVLLVATLPEAEIRYANRALSDVLGHEPAEVIGDELRLLFPDEDTFEGYMGQVRHELDDGVFRFSGEHVLCKADGRRVWTEIITTIVGYEGEDSQRLLLALRDISDRKIGDEALVRSHARLALLNSILAGMRAEMSEDQIIEMTLRRVSEYYRDLRVAYATVDEGANLVVTQSIEPPGMPTLAGYGADLALAPAYLRALRRLEPFVVEDTAADERLGELADALRATRSGALLDVPLGDVEQQEPTGVLRIDSLERRRWSTHEIVTLGEVAKYLAVAINDAGSRQQRELLETQLRQAQKMEAIGRLAGGVAHDFNNLLTGITGYTQLLLNRVDEAELRADLDKIAEFSKRAARLTQQLLAFSRRQPLEVKVFDLNELIDNTSKMLRPIIGEDVRLEFAPTPDVGDVRADPGQIEQVIMNLAVNARDAMPAGGNLIIETGNAVFEREYADRQLTIGPGAFVTLAMTDTGSGMDAETARRIFEPFFTTKEHGKGTGLGLSTAYGIVKQHGGGIWVHSEAGIGTTFKVFLKPAGGEAMEVAAMGRAERPPAATIFVVEPDARVRAFLGSALRDAGYRVMSAAHDDEAVELCRRRTGDIDLLLTDLALANQAGERLYSSLREIGTGMRALFMTGFTERAMRRHGALSSQVTVLEKPFGTRRLIGKVRAALGDFR